MKRVKEDFLREVLKQTNTPVHLVAVEISPSYVSPIIPWNNDQEIKNKFSITDALAERLTKDSPDFVSRPISGEIWIASFENGNNIGTRRKIESIYSGEIPYVTISGEVDFKIKLNYVDRIRVSKYLCLAMTNVDVPFYFPDSSNGGDFPVTYKKFPFSLTPMGSSIDGEIINMNVAVANVNRMLGNIVQEADGIRGNRVTHLTTFGQFLGDEYGRQYCLEESMYVDSTSISNSVVSFKLESRFNIMSLELPLCNYSRNFCRWKYRTPECGWPPSGRPSMMSGEYPLVLEDRCDHSIIGPNGCAAHNNTVRFGGFPSITSR